MDTSSSGTSWLDVLQTGISAYVDSQYANAFAAQNATYNTAGGTAGQAQQTAVKAANNNALLWVAVGVGALLLGALIIKKL